jgi:serine/threonine protein phosphatase 1
MWKPRFFSSTPRPLPRLPDGLRIYAVGDIHGRVDLLDWLLAGIDADLDERPVSKSIHVFLGDYIDRGPQSAAVLDRLISRAKTHPTLCLKGNHESYLLEFLQDPGILEGWGQYGGLATLLSYGLRPTMQAGPAEQEELAVALERVLPESHRKFLAGMPLSFTCGDYFFVHAGVRPGTSLARQREEDLLWIRGDFLLHEGDFEKVIVHGHTPVRDPELRQNRINIDTGAYATGRLTCLVLEKDEKAFIYTNAPK